MSMFIFIKQKHIAGHLKKQNNRNDNEFNHNLLIILALHK
ncbi:hypothetical protein SALWKB2_0185 [Snodgrassella alvi wkB2]|nr:hypothetical protein SALWKB2_0185 [Snodgrassella alvi wkB2]